MAALHFNLSWLTAKRWAERYVVMSRDGMVHRSSRPHSNPTKTNPALVRKNWASAMEATSGPDRDRRETGHARINGARGVGPLLAEPAALYR